MGNLLSAGMYRLKYSKLFYILLGLLVVTLTLCYIQAIPQTVSLDVSPTEAVAHEEDTLPWNMRNRLLSILSTPSFSICASQFNLLRRILPPVFESRVQRRCFAQQADCGTKQNPDLSGKFDSQRAVRRSDDGGRILTGLCVGMPMLKGFGETEPSTLVMYGLFSLITTWACVSLFTMAAMIVANRAVAVALCIVLAFGLYFWASF